MNLIWWRFCSKLISNQWHFHNFQEINGYTKIAYALYIIYSTNISCCVFIYITDKHQTSYCRNKIFIFLNKNSMYIVKVKQILSEKRFLIFSKTLNCSISYWHLFSNYILLQNLTLLNLFIQLIELKNQYYIYYR